MPTKRAWEFGKALAEMAINAEENHMTDEMPGEIWAASNAHSGNTTGFWNLAQTPRFKRVVKTSYTLTTLHISALDEIAKGEADIDTYQKIVAEKDVEISGLREAVRDMAGMLRDIREWKLPESGVFYPNNDGSISDRPAPYDSVYANGSNGAREYFKERATQLIAKHAHLIGDE